MAKMSDYERLTPASRKLFERARKVFAGGVSHNARLYQPYPIYAKRAKGQYVWDEDGNRYVDYWMGHMALILGHSPAVVVEALRNQVGEGTHFGMSSRYSVELGEEIQRTVPCAEMVRFCSSGAEATMYLIRVARAFTRRKTVIKMAGGWHGYNTDLNKGVHGPRYRTEGEGILPEEQRHVVTVTFNDLDKARAAVRAAKGDVAAIFLEPVLGAGGCIPAEKEYLKGLRELADESGAMLAFDEIITGYRLALGGAQERYGVKADIASLGKTVGGGLPIGLICGIEEAISLADPTRKERFVSIGGGTFSENPLTMVAGLATVKYLRRNADRIYPRLEEGGRELRKGVDRAIRESGIKATTTGMGSLFLTHFDGAPSNAQEASRNDKKVSLAYYLDLMSQGIFILPGHPGGISTAHTKADIGALVRASGRAAEKLARGR
jgi:glutamate-1-semialdehyde 2,1-aminomutase